MATASIFRDTRREKETPECPIKIMISHKSAPALLNTGMKAKADEWEETISRTTGKPVSARFSQKKKDYKVLNNELQLILAEVREFIRDLERTGRISLYSSIDIKREYKKSKLQVFSKNTFSDYAKLHRDTFAKALNREKYDIAISRVNDFALYKNASGKEKERIKAEIAGRRPGKRGDARKEVSVLFEEITTDWLREFDLFLSETGTASPNGRRPIMSCIRAIFNAARKAQIIPNDLYPFDSFTIKKAKTRKRTLQADVIRKIRDLSTDEPGLAEARDFFMLSFYLIGINPVDMYGIAGTAPNGVNLTEGGYVQDGILHYRRAKTGRLYDIKVPAEAMEIIGRNRGETKLLRWCEMFKEFRNFYHHMNFRLKQLGEAVGFPGLTQYYARHTWASMARQAGVTKDIIACALGHEEVGDDVTWGYIQLEQGVVDRANDATIAFLMSDKRTPATSGLSDAEKRLLNRLGFEVSVRDGVTAIERIPAGA